MIYHFYNVFIVSEKTCKGLLCSTTTWLESLERENTNRWHTTHVLDRNHMSDGTGDIPYKLLLRSHLTYLYWVCNTPCKERRNWLTRDKTILVYSTDAAYDYCHWLLLFRRNLFYKCNFVSLYWNIYIVLEKLLGKQLLGKTVCFWLIQQIKHPTNQCTSSHWSYKNPNFHKAETLLNCPLRSKRCFK